MNEIEHFGIERYTKNRNNNSFYSIEDALFDIKQELNLILGAYCLTSQHLAIKDSIVNAILEKVVKPICKTEEEWLGQITQLKDENIRLRKNLFAAFGEPKVVFAVIRLHSYIQDVTAFDIYDSVKEAVTDLEKKNHKDYALYFSSRHISEKEIELYKKEIEKENTDK